MRQNELDVSWKQSVITRDNWKYKCEDELEFPRIIHFETHSFCNASCIMCPYKDVHDENKKGYMNEKLMDKIINECVEYDRNMEYEFLPYLMNEPSLDCRVPNLIRKIKGQLPASAVSFYTNGTLMNEKFWTDLVDSEPDSIVFSINSIDEKEYNRITGGLNLKDFIHNIEFVRSQINKKEKRIEILTHVLHMGKSVGALIDIMKYWKERHIKCRTAYLENRGGDVNVQKLSQDLNYWAPNKCWRVLTQIHVLYDGQVLLCCGDWNQSVILGDLNKQSIYEVWNSAQYKKIRLNHKMNNVKELPEICKKCNMI